jgi:hypothetical protein
MLLLSSGFLEFLLLLWSILLLAPVLLLKSANIPTLLSLVFPQVLVSAVVGIPWDPVVSGAAVTLLLLMFLLLLTSLESLLWPVPLLLTSLSLLLLVLLTFLVFVLLLLALLLLVSLLFLESLMLLVYLTLLTFLLLLDIHCW